MSDLHAEIEELPGSITFIHHLARVIYGGRLEGEVHGIASRLSTIAYSGLFDPAVPIVNRVIDRQSEFDHLFAGTKLGDEIRPRYHSRKTGHTRERLFTVGMMTGKQGGVTSRPILDLYLGGLSVTRMWQVAQYAVADEAVVE